MLPSRVLAIVVLLLLSVQVVFPAHATKAISQSQLSLTLNPSTVIIKVGDTATINVTVVNLQNTSLSQVCFQIEGFPTSGFITSIAPECSALQPYKTLTAQLNVTATPAAAPQNVTALIVAGNGTQVAQAFLSITVVPGIPAWIPWSMIVIFVLILGASLLYGNRRKRGRRK